MEEIEVVAFACRGTLVDWTGAIEAVVYELARRNGESPLDRGAALRRRVDALADGHGLARGFERLARERGYRGEESGEESLARVVALARPLPGARAAVALAGRDGRRVVAVSRGEVPDALYSLGAAFATVLSALDPYTFGVVPQRMLYVSASAAARRRASELGVRTTSPAGLQLALARPLTAVAA